MIFLSAISTLMLGSPSFLVVDHLVIGSFENKAWKRIETIQNQQQAIPFSKVGIGKLEGSWTAKGLIKGGPGDAGYVDGEEGQIPNGVLFSGKVGFPRKVQVLSNSNSSYLAVLGKFLKKHNISSKPRLTKVVRADLDGNGTLEVILEASNRDDLTSLGMHGVAKGDYSLVLLRYESKGKVVEYPLAFDHPTAEQMNYKNKLAAIADFDGNGVMDVVVTSDYYEGQSAKLFSYKGSQVKKLVEMGDGA